MPDASTLTPGTRISVPLGNGTVLRTEPGGQDDRAPYAFFRLDGQPEGSESAIVAGSPYLWRLCDVCDTVGDDSMPGSDTTCGYCLAKAAVTTTP